MRAGSLLGFEYLMFTEFRVFLVLMRYIAVPECRLSKFRFSGFV